MTLRCPADHTGAKKKKRRDRGGIDTIQTVRTRDILIDGIWNWKREYFEETQTLLTTIAKNERKGRLFHAAIKDLLSISLFCWNDDDPDIHSKKCFWWDAHPITAWLSAIHPPSESGVVVVMDWDARGRSSESDWNNASFPLFFPPPNNPGLPVADVCAFIQTFGFPSRRPSTPLGVRAMNNWIGPRRLLSSSSCLLCVCVSIPWWAC